MLENVTVSIDKYFQSMVCLLEHVCKVYGIYRTYIHIYPAKSERINILNRIDWHSLFYQENGTKRAVVNVLIVIINVFIWCILELFGDTMNGLYILRYGGMYPDLLLHQNEWYRLLTAMFLHFGAQHLANNMILLAAAGGILERSIGSIRYLIIYLGSGIIGNMLSFYIMVRTDDYAICAGASGAVFGMIGALVWTAIRNKGRIEGITTKGLLFMIALCLYYGITTSGIDNWAHAGGAVSGFFLCILLYRKRRYA